MSDVFISYSQKLPEPTEALAADLGARGYAYWYDTRLLPTDVFWRASRTGRASPRLLRRSRFR